MSLAPFPLFFLSFFPPLSLYFLPLLSFSGKIRLLRISTTSAKLDHDADPTGIAPTTSSPSYTPSRRIAVADTGIILAMDWVFMHVVIPHSLRSCMWLSYLMERIEDYICTVQDRVLWFGVQIDASFGREKAMSILQMVHFGGLF